MVGCFVCCCVRLGFYFGFCVYCVWLAVVWLFGLMICVWFGNWWFGEFVGFALWLWCYLLFIVVADFVVCLLFIVVSSCCECR